MRLHVVSTVRSSAFRTSALSFANNHLDGIKVRTIGRQEEEVRSGIADRVAGGLAFVASQIVQNDDVTSFQGWNQALLHPRGECTAVDGAIEHKGGDDAVAAQTGQKGQRLPVTMRNLCNQRLSTLAPAAGARHVGFDPGFVNEDKPIRIKSMLMGLPACPEPGHLRPVLLVCHQGFF